MLLLCRMEQGEVQNCMKTKKNDRIKCADLKSEDLLEALPSDVSIREVNMS